MEPSCAAQPARNKTGHGERLAAEQLKLTLRNVRPNIVMMPLFAAIICAIFARWVPLANLATWFALAITGTVIQAAIIPDLTFIVLRTSLVAG